MMEACMEYDFPEGAVPEMPEKRCYTVDDLMLILECGRRTVYDLLKKKHLIFLTDGAKDIRKNIEEVFKFRSYSIILDWYHLKKRCQEYLSMSVKGGNEKRNEILQKLLRILWAGNVDEAVHYLSTGSAKKSL